MPWPSTPWHSSSASTALPRAYNRTREGNFSLQGLTGFDLVGKRVGVVGSGQIGAVFARIMQGFGCEVQLHDPYPNPELERLGMRYVAIDEGDRPAAISSACTARSPKRPVT